MSNVIVCQTRLSVYIADFLYTLCDTPSVILAESGKGKIEEDAVHVKADELLPQAELLLSIPIQVGAKKYFTTDAWKTVESTLRILEGKL